MTEDLTKYEEALPCGSDPWDYESPVKNQRDNKRHNKREVKVRSEKIEFRQSQRLNAKKGQARISISSSEDEKNKKKRKIKR